MEAHEHGVVTSASLMVRWPAAAEAAAYGRRHRALSLGLHLDLGEWVCRDGAWERLYAVVPEDDPAKVSREVRRQLAVFRRLVGRDPTHIDSHQHIHLKRLARGVVRELAAKLGVPLRRLTPTVRYTGDFYGQAVDGRPLPKLITADALIGILATLRPGFTELGCHPGKLNDFDSMYLSERPREVEALCDPRIRAAIADMGIKLCSFHDVSVTWTDAEPRRPQKYEPAI